MLPEDLAVIETSYAELLRRKHVNLLNAASTMNVTASNSSTFLVSSVNTGLYHTQTTDSKLLPDGFDSATDMKILPDDFDPTTDIKIVSDTIQLRPKNNTHEKFPHQNINLFSNERKVNDDVNLKSIYERILNHPAEISNRTHDFADEKIKLRHKRIIATDVQSNLNKVGMNSSSTSGQDEYRNPKSKPFLPSKEGDMTLGSILATKLV